MPARLLADRYARTASIIASSTLAGSAVANLTDDRLLTSWSANAAGAQTLTIDSGAAVSADSLALLHTNLLTAGATIKVETSPDSADWTEVVAAVAAALDAGTLLSWTVSSLRYRRVTITTASIKPVIGTLCLGTALDLPRSLRPAQRQIEIKQASALDSSGEAYCYNRQPFDGINHPLTFRRMALAQRAALETLHRRDVVGMRSFFAWQDHLGIVHPVRNAENNLKFVEDGLDRYRIDVTWREESAAL